MSEQTYFDQSRMAARNANVGHAVKHGRYGMCEIIDCDAEYVLLLHPTGIKQAMSRTNLKLTGGKTINSKLHLSTV